MKLFDVVSTKEALNVMKENFSFKLSEEKVSFFNSVNRYVSQDIESEINVPHFRKSLVDGYAVLAKDVFLASESNPVPLNLIGESYMGEICNKILDSEEAVYVPTGGMVPVNAEGVVMIEYAEKLGEDTVLIEKGVSLNELLKLPVFFRELTVCPQFPVFRLWACVSAMIVEKLQ